jgi:hypothetical protein
MLLGRQGSFLLKKYQIFSLNEGSYIYFTQIIFGISGEKILGKFSYVHGILRIFERFHYYEQL